jgi:hypothetical protein
METSSGGCPAIRIGRSIAGSVKSAFNIEDVLKR